MKTDYLLHDESYQRKRQDSTYAGWNKAEGLAADIQNMWQPLMQRDAFPKQGKLLELGCGAGNLSLYFAKAGYEVAGIDIAPTAIEWARENAASAQVEIQFIQGDVLTLAGIADESFDIALDGHCFHCIIGCDRNSFLQATHRVLKPGGVLVICSMCNQVPNTPRLREQFDPRSRCLMYNGIATRYIGDSNEILQEIMAANFRIRDVKLAPPSHAEDFADVQVIAEKESFNSTR